MRPLEKMRNLIFLLCLIIPVFATDPSVIIIGAGPAGIAAAAKLWENGIKDVKILEAEDRIGGRIHSVFFGDAFVDLGAEFCHGKNIVYDMVKNLDLLDPPDLFYNESFIVYDSRGERIDDELVNEILEFVTFDLDLILLKYNFKINDSSYYNSDEYISSRSSSSSGSSSTSESSDSSDNSDSSDSNSYESNNEEYSIYDEDYEEETTSLGEYFLEVYNKTIMQKYIDDENKSEILKNFIPVLEKIFLTYEGSFSWYQSSAESHYMDSAGEESMTWGGHGYKAILDVLLKAYPHPERKLPIDILHHKIVSKITMNENKIVVDCLDNSAYTADHVIFTPSIGVLKEQHNKLFDPPLPEWKQNAIDGIGFGGVMKIILHFPEKWWDEEFDNLVFVWNSEELSTSGEEFPDGVVQNGISWITQIHTLVQSSNNSNVLIAWVTGPLVPKIEQLPEKTLKNGVMHLIQKFIGNDYNVTDPDEIIYSSWCTNQHFRGTYSFETPESYMNGSWYQKDLGKPINSEKGIPMVLFAGEATSPTHFGTVHGAIESGRREAKRIIKLYKNTV